LTETGGRAKIVNRDFANRLAPGSHKQLSGNILRLSFGPSRAMALPLLNGRASAAGLQPWADRLIEHDSVLAAKRFSEE
jgi:hypothetical protein